MRKPSGNYFYFTRKERTGIITIILIAATLVFIPFLFRSVRSDRSFASDKYSSELAALEKIESDSAKRRLNYTDGYGNRTYVKANNKNKGELFYFDPNDLSSEGWKRLGLRDRTIGMILKYISKGGKFRKAEDIKNIWGLEEQLAERLIPYVRINLKEDSFRRAEFKNTYPAKKEYHAVDINLADSNSLATLPGIGERLSQRIIKYRDKLGGFYSADQVAETFGLADSIYKKIRPSLHIGDGGVRKININLATIDELKSHPYIRYHLANAIFQYRQQHGNYKDISDLRHIMLINDSIYNKVSGYLSTE